MLEIFGDLWEVEADLRVNTTNPAERENRRTGLEQRIVACSPCRTQQSGRCEG